MRIVPANLASAIISSCYLIFFFAGLYLYYIPLLGQPISLFLNKSVIDLLAVLLLLPISVVFAAFAVIILASSLRWLTY